MKKCSKCGITQPLENFSKGSGYVGGRRHTCKACSNKNRRARPRTDATPEARRKYSLSTNYGLTVEQYEAMALAQDNKCAICGIPGTETRHNKLYVDHCHKSGRVRRLLCGMCNSGLGYFRDSPELLSNAIKYISGF